MCLFFLHSVLLFGIRIDFFSPSLPLCRFFLLSSILDFFSGSVSHSRRRRPRPSLLFSWFSFSLIWLRVRIRIYRG